MRPWTRWPWQTQRLSTVYSSYRHLHTNLTTGYSAKCLSFSCRPASTSIVSHTFHGLPIPPLSHYTQDHQSPPPTFPRTNPHDAASWILLLESCLPIELRHNGHELPIASPMVASQILEKAHKSRAFDLLAQLSVVNGRWHATTWLACAIVDDTFAPSEPWQIPDVFSSLQWPEFSLKSLTSARFSKKDIESGDADAYRPRLLTAPELSRDSRSLTRTLKNRQTSAHDDAAAIRARTRLGQILVSLGRMIFAAVDHGENQSAKVISSVLIVLSSFHSKGFLPSELGRAGVPAVTSALQQPPFIPILTSHLLNYVRNSAGTHSLDPDTQTQLLVVLQQGTDDAVDVMAPELWLEYILWCCIHGGWLVEGVSILTGTRNDFQQSQWELQYWRAGLQLDVKGSSTFNSGDRTIQPAEDLGARRKVSTEVAIALADGFVTMLQYDQRATGYTMGWIVAELQALRRLLKRDNMSLGFMTWDSIITRIAESRGMDGSKTENILSLAIVPDSKRRTGHALAEISGAETIDYVFEGSAAVLGLYHRTLHAHVRARDIDGALRVLAALQKLTDENQALSMAGFFAELKERDMEPQVDDGEQIGLDSFSFQREHRPILFPSLPTNVLADLLDLLTDHNATELGWWLIHSSEVDGPLIPEHEHGNQILAPALIRFAAATSDTELLRRLSTEQATSITGLTLVALCESRIQLGQFQGASQVLGLIRDYALHEWTAEDLTRVLRALLLQIYGAGLTRDLGDPHSQEASVLCQRLLRGDLGQVWGEGFVSRIDTIAEILCSLDDHLAGLCTNLMPLGQKIAADLPEVAFQHLLDVIAKIWGSGKGKEVWMSWCREDGVRQSTRNGASSSRSVGEMFSAGTDASALLGTQSDVTAYTLPLTTGRIKPSLPLMKIIILQALEEQRQRIAKDFSPGDMDVPEVELFVRSQPHAILDWAYEVLRSEFGLSMTDADYQLQGYHYTRRPVSRRHANYSPATIQIWRAFEGSRKRWALKAEDSLRRFARSQGDSLSFEDPAAARVLVVCLAQDLGLVTDVIAEGERRAIMVTRPGPNERRARVPEQKLDDCIRYEQWV